MYVVIFEVWPKAHGKEEYLRISAQLREYLQGRDGFISLERFQSFHEESKILSLSFWRDEAAIEAWRNMPKHREAQQKGRSQLFESYRIRVAEILRDYTDSDRKEVPSDSIIAFS